MSDLRARPGINFRRRGDIIRDGIRVGWIEKKDDFEPVWWKIRLTPASGMPGVLPTRYSRLKDAKNAAIKAISKSPEPC